MSGAEFVECYHCVSVIQAWPASRYAYIGSELQRRFQYKCIVTCEGAHEFVYDRSGLSLSTPYSTISASHRTSPLQYQIWTCHSSYHIMEALVILTMPHASTSCVLRIRLVSMSFIARSLPTACARYCDSLPPVIVPMFAFGPPNLAMGAARSRFAISASLHSPPICTYEDTW